MIMQNVNTQYTIQITSLYQVNKVTSQEEEFAQYLGISESSLKLVNEIVANCGVSPFPYSIDSNDDIHLDYTPKNWNAIEIRAIGNLARFLEKHTIQTAEGKNGIKCYDGAKTTFVPTHPDIKEVFKFYPTNGVFLAEKAAQDKLGTTGLQDLAVYHSEWDSDAQTCISEKCEKKWTEEAYMEIQGALATKNLICGDIAHGDNIGLAKRKGEYAYVIFDIKSIKPIKLD